MSNEADVTLGTDSFECDVCAAEVSAPTWVVIDAKMRLDLVDDLAYGRLNHYRCQTCGYDGIRKTPVVLHRLFDHVPIVISPTGDGMSEDAGGLAFYWANEVGRTIGKGENWIQELVDNGLPIIPRAQLSELVRRPRVPDREELVEALGALVAARTWGEIVTLIDEHPSLLGDDAEAWLRRGVNSLEMEGRHDDAKWWSRRLEFVRLVRAVGVDQALRDRIGFTLDQREP